MSARLAATLLATASAVHAQTILYVDDDAAPGGDGLAWETAFTNLHAALDIANAGGDAIEIRIADGLYIPEVGAYDVDSGAVVSLRGAFGGLNADNPDLQDFLKYATHLNADVLQNDDGTPESKFDNWGTLVYMEGPHPGDILLEGLRFEQADSPHSGALRLRDSSPLVTDCAFVDNVSRDKGAGVRIRSGAPTFLRCRFERNTAELFGGAFYSQSAALMMNECTFVDNFAEREGGALGVSGAESQIRRTTFVGNTSESRGAALYVNDAGDLPTHVTIASSIFLQNTLVDEFYATAMWVRGDTEVHGCTFVDNGGFGDPGPSIGVDERYTLVGSNNIFWETGLPPQGDHEFSIVQGGLDGEGNLDVDPSFVDLKAGDLRLSPYSPAIDAGTNEFVLTGRDVAGLPRLADDPATEDTGFGRAPIVDMGAHEFQGSSCYADFNADGSLNVLDFVAFQQAFQASTPKADCHADGELTIIDFVCFQKAWRAGCP